MTFWEANESQRAAEAHEIPLKKLRPDAVVPAYQRPGDAGFDLCVCESVTVPAGGVAILPTGLAVAIPAGFELQIRLRSSVALRTPLILPNAPGTVDSGYRGELGIVVRNLDSRPYTVKKGDRIAQGVLARVYEAKFCETAELPPSARGCGGYGSTGRN